MSYQMTQEHKDKLARGRHQASIVKRYLNSLQTKGENLDADEIREKVAAIDAAYPSGNPMIDLKMISRREMLEQQLAQAKNTENPEALEREFIDVAADYSQAKGITYKAWRQIGVPTSVLKRANIPDGRTTRHGGTTRRRHKNHAAA